MYKTVGRLGRSIKWDALGLRITVRRDIGNVLVNPRFIPEIRFSHM